MTSSNENLFFLPSGCCLFIFSPQSPGYVLQIWASGQEECGRAIRKRGGDMLVIFGRDLGGEGIQSRTARLRFHFKRLNAGGVVIVCVS